MRGGGAGSGRGGWWSGCTRLCSRAAARAWIVNEPTAKDRRINVVLGGGLENRPFEAARLYHAGVAHKVLFMDVKLSPTGKLGITPSEQELTRKVLRQQAWRRGT